MPTVVYPQDNPFDAATGDLLPAYRDAYLQGRLAPTVALQVEIYLKGSAIQRGVLLGRHHELAAAARAQGRTVATPLWVQQQLRYQASGSRVGPLRRPVVRVALGMFAGLAVASGVQWARNEPLVPAPVVAAVTRVAASATQVTQRLVERFTEPAAPALAPAPALVPKRPVVARAAVPAAPAPRDAAETPALEPRPAPIALLLADSLASALPAALPGTRAVGGAAASRGVAPAPATASAGTVRGRISDAQGRPLVGATVLVKGTQRATSTNATGNYVLDVPARATLQFGYAGCTDLVRSATIGTMNVTLQPNVVEEERLTGQR